MHTRDTAQQGNVLFLILVAVALVGALSAVLMQGGGEQAVSMMADKTAQELRAQGQAIRSAILECDLMNNFGYPPQSYDGSEMKDVGCQTDNAPTYQMIFTGTANRFIPQPPGGFAQWRYYNDGAGTISLKICTTSGTVDAGQASAFSMLAAQYTTTEADVNQGGDGCLNIYITKP